MLTSTISSYAQFTEAVAAARSAAAAYYDTDHVQMSDAEYDALVDAIAAATETHPDWDDDGILTRVAAGSSAGGALTHPRPMLSLDKTTDIADLTAFVRAVAGPVAVEMKLDGNAVRASYHNGTLVALATRGDGTTGEPLDLTLTIDGLPAAIDAPGEFHVTGEVYMTDDDFHRSNSNRIASGKPAFAKPRNAASGVLRRETKTFDAFLSFAAYDAYGTPDIDRIDDYHQRMAVVSGYGIRTVTGLHASVGLPLAASTSERVIGDHVNAIQSARPRLPVGIDGAVLKAVSIPDRDRLGTATRHPKWALAYKFAAQEATSTLAGIDIGVGRTGQMSLTAVLQPPVTIDGSVIERATLHNPAFITNQRLGIGSRVLVVLANDIIPRVTGLHDQADTIPVWTPPPVCPNCEQPWDTSGVMWRCRTYSCALANTLAYAASRDVLDIDGLGEEAACALVEAGHISDLADLFTLTVPQVATTQIGTTPGGNPKLIGHVTATTIVNGIHASRTQPLHRIVCALGIPKMGRTMSRRLVTHFGSLAALRTADEAAFMTVDGVAAEKARIYVNGFAGMSATIDRLIAAGVTTETGTPAIDAPAPLAGMTVVVTGAMTGTRLAGLSRQQVNDLIEQAGGRASGSVSARTSLLVCSEPGSVKHLKATQLGIPIISPDDFADSVTDYLPTT